MSAQIKVVDDTKKPESSIASKAASGAASGLKSFVRVMLSALFPLTVGLVTHYVGEMYFPGFGKPASWSTLQVAYALPALLAVIVLAVWLGYEVWSVNDDDATSDALKRETLVSTFCAIVAGIVFGAMFSTGTFYLAAIIGVLATWTDGLLAGPGSINSVIRKFSFGKK